MKSILLASASIVAFAGAASAQAVTFGGEAELGFNDEEEDGFFYTADLNVTFTADLGGGLTSNVTFTIPVVDGNTGEDSIGSADYLLALEAEGMGGLYFGDTGFAAEQHWDPGFAMLSDDFSEQDNETVIRGDSTFGGFEVSLSGIVQDGDGDRPGEGGTADDRDYIDQISLGMSGNAGLFALDFAYQEESQLAGVVDDLDAGIDGVYDSSNGDFDPNERVALAAGATFGGADLKFGVSSDLTAETTSYGVLVRYPVGPVSLAASYTFEPDAPVGNDDYSWSLGAEYENGPFAVDVYYESVTGDEEYGVEVVYSPSDLTTYYVGYIDDVDNDGIEDVIDQDEGFYIAARQAISDNAYVEASYAEFGDAGPEEVREGSTLLVGLTF